MFHVPGPDSRDMEESMLPSELLQVVKLSLKATAFDISMADDNETFDPRNPALRKLVEAVLYSRKFVLTYYVILAALLFLFTTVRFTKILLSRRKVKTSGVATPASYGSSSSTLRGDASPQEQTDPERTPLLLKTSWAGGSSSGGILSRVATFTSSLWMYQPQPIPALTSPKNVLPANGTTVAVTVMFGINIFYLLYHTTLSIPMLFAFADRAGLCFVMNLPILYLLGAKTNQPIQFLTGWSYEGLNIFHRRLGEWMTALAAMHSVGMMGVWYTLLRPLHFTLLRFVSSRVGLFGMFTFLAYISIYVSSVGWVRRLFYERFLLLHVVLQVAALVFLFFHHHNSRPYVLASLGIWTLDRIVLRNVVSSQRLIATLEIASDQKTVLLHCTVPIRRSRLRIRVSIFNGWQASQHVFVTLPDLGFVQHRLQTHPFTIASPAPPTDYTGPWPLQLVIRAQDGFSKQLVEHAKLHQHAEVLLDGPYGSTETLDVIHRADRVYFVAGGSGIAVTYPLAWDLLTHPGSDSAISRRTTYAHVRVTTPTITGYDKLNSVNYHHIWIRQDPRSDEWISYVPRSDTMQAAQYTLSKPILRKDSDRAVDLITSRFDTAGIHALRPDVSAELQEWVELGSDASLKAGSGSGRTVVVVSGPDGLVRSVRNSAAALVRRGHDVDVYVEKFGW